jgi:hypothetical protein
MLTLYGNSEILFVLRRRTLAFNGRTIWRPPQSVCLQVSSPELPNPWEGKVGEHTRLTTGYISFLYRSCPRPEQCSLAWMYKERIWNYWVFGLFPSSGILGTRKNDVSETGSVSVLRCVGRKTPTQLGPLDRASLYHWTSALSKGPN